ncbi:HEPN domain-containing protein [Nocardia nova]|uniref:ApeA N-terminal domain 1-containing protein n=1 Tax=Nocardia nova TaxID=37330 RepID=UPI0011B05018|nr:HEPN domain-containing protein [Nocardia nova]
MTESDSQSREPAKTVEATAQKVAVPPPAGIRDEPTSTVAVREIMHGIWWVADTPGHALPGVLTLGHGTDPRLELNEVLVEPRSRRGLFTVHGESGRKKVTLLGAADTETITEQTGHGRYRRQVIEAFTGALVGGKHLADADDEVFIEAFVEIDYLSFLAKVAEPGYSQRETRPDGTEVATITIPLAGIRSGRFGDLDVDLVPAEHDDRQAFLIDMTRAPAQFRAVLRLRRGGKPTSVETFEAAARRLSDLVTLAMQRPAHVRRIVFDAKPDIRDNRFQWWGQDPPPRQQVIDGAARRDINFTFDDVEFATMLRAWHDLLTNTAFSVNSIIALLRETSTYHETKLLGVGGALEALAKRFVQSNTYREQAAELAQIIAPAVRDRVVPDVDKWAGYIKKARNSLAHGDEVHERDVPEDVWFALEHPTMAVLILVLMTKLGVPEKVQRRSVEYGGLRHWSELGTQHFPRIEADDLPNDAAVPTDGQ